MGRYLQLLDRAAPRERRGDKSDKSDKSPHRSDEATPFGRLCRFGRSPNAPDPTAAWNEANEERAAIVEYDGGAPRAWAEALAQLAPNKPPADVPAKRWLRFIDDCGRFLDGRWPAKAADFGWGALDLFGCDRERPFARIDHMGLLWLSNGGTIIELYRDRAVLKTQSGARQTYHRRPVEVGRVVLAWELADAET
jgi:hypothetical protein